MLLALIFDLSAVAVQLRITQLQGTSAAAKQHWQALGHNTVVSSAHLPWNAQPQPLLSITPCIPHRMNQQQPKTLNHA
jgi:hypothetical protein